MVCFFAAQKDYANSLKKPNLNLQVLGFQINEKRLFGIRSEEILFTQNTTSNKI